MDQKKSEGYLYKHFKVWIEEQPHPLEMSIWLDDELNPGKPKSNPRWDMTKWMRHVQISKDASWW